MCDHLLESIRLNGNSILCGYGREITKTMKYARLNLSLLHVVVDFEDHWRPSQTMWTQMKPHEMWCLI